MKKSSSKWISFVFLFFGISMVGDLALSSVQEERPSPVQNVVSPTGETAKTKVSEESPMQAASLEEWKFTLGFYSLFITGSALTIGILLFMYLVHRDPQNRFLQYFGQGKLTQLIVIITVAGNVCSLAMMGFLTGGEISAIYGSIVGYVLGKRFRNEEGEGGPETKSKKLGQAGSPDE